MSRFTRVLGTLAVAGVAVLGLAATHEAEARPRVSVWVGGPFWWGAAPYGYGYGYGPAYYPYVVERPVIVQQPAEPTVVVPSAAQQSPSWYYCRESQMYYPHVSTCPGGWQEVPATPPPAPAAAPVTTPAPAVESSQAPAATGSSTSTVPATPAPRTGTPVPKR